MRWSTNPGPAVRVREQAAVVDLTRVSGLPILNKISLVKDEDRADKTGVTISEEVPTAFTEEVGVVETTISLNAEGNINIVEELVPRGSG